MTSFLARQKPLFAIRTARFVVHIWLILVSSAVLWGQPGYNDFSVEYFTPEQGYSNAIPTRFLQDKIGVMRIGTENGLCRYDGTFRLLERQPNNPFSLSHNVVKTLYEDNEGTLWIGTAGGLNRFDPTRNTFTRYVYHSDDLSSLADENIQSIQADAQGRLWVVAGNILHHFDKRTGRVRQQPYYLRTFAKGHFVSTTLPKCFTFHLHSFIKEGNEGWFCKSPIENYCRSFLSSASKAAVFAF